MLIKVEFWKDLNTKFALCEWFIVFFAFRYLIDRYIG